MGNPSNGPMKVKVSHKRSSTQRVKGCFAPLIDMLGILQVRPSRLTIIVAISRGLVELEGKRVNTLECHKRLGGGVE